MTVPGSSPAAASSSAIEPKHLVSFLSATLTHTGRHEPQKRLREMFQSLASRSQLPKRLAPIASGIQRICALLASRRSRRSSTRTYHASMAR